MFLTFLFYVKIDMVIFMKLKLLSYEKTCLPAGWKPYYIYEIVVEQMTVGTIVLREGTNEERYFDGHIGYSIDEEFRGHHYSQEACLLLFDIAREKGFQELIITCSPDNIASRKIIESLPFIFLEEKAIPKELRKNFEANEKIKRIYKICL